MFASFCFTYLCNNHVYLNNETIEQKKEKESSSEPLFSEPQMSHFISLSASLSLSW